MFSRYRNIFPKGISKSDKQKWKNALYFFHKHFPSKKIDRILIEEKGVHGYPFVADNSFYKVELQTESTTLFKRKNNILALMQYPLKGVVYPKKITNDDKCIIYEYKHYPDGDLFTKLIDYELNFQEIDSFFKQMLKIIDNIHRQGFIHRDIKLENILVSGKDILLTDIEYMQSFSQLDNFYGGTYTYLPPKFNMYSPLQLEYYSFGKSILKALYLQDFIAGESIKNWIDEQESSVFFQNLDFNDYPVVIRKWINIGVTCCVNIETNDFEYDSLQSLYNSFK